MAMSAIAIFDLLHKLETCEYVSKSVQVA